MTPNESTPSILDRWWVPAAIFAVLGVAHVFCSPVGEPYKNNDETRQVMTGVFVRDAIRDLPASAADPRGYAVRYYAQYPALGLLVWPPFFHLVEGLAMGAFATLYQKSSDPLLVKLCQLVMTDEAFHHKFGKIWADRTIPRLSSEEHNLVEDWAAQCFQTLLFNLVNPEQMKPVYASVGIEWQEAMAAIQEAFGDDQRREQMKQSANIFRVLIKTLLNAGIITERTRAFYAVYVDMDELRREGDRMVGDDIAEEGIRFLKGINFRAGTAVAMAAE